MGLLKNIVAKAGTAIKSVKSNIKEKGGLKNIAAATNPINVVIQWEDV